MVITMYYFHKCASVAWDFLSWGMSWGMAWSSVAWGLVLGNVLGYGLVKCGLILCLGVWLGQVLLGILSWGMSWGEG